MKNNLLSCIILIFIGLSGRFSAQTYQLTGNPVNTAGWDLVSSALINTDFIQLTPDTGGQYGAIKLQDPINLKYCDKWKVEFDFRIDGNGTTTYGRGDGFTFWYLANPPTGFVSGGGLGIPANASGLMVGFDIFNNSTEGQMSKIHLLYGTNNGTNNNIEYNNTAGSTFHSPDLNPTQPFVGATYKHVEVNGETDPANPTNWLIKIKIDGVVIVDQSFAPSGGAIGMTTGYFGFSAATGGASARHSIKNAKIYIDKVPILTNTINPFVCVNPSTGNGTVDLTSFQNQFVTNPANYTFSYFGPGGTPITNPSSYQYGTGTTTITVVVKDPSSTLCDNGDGKIVLTPSPFAANDVTLTGCNNNNAGGAVFDLTSANLSSVPGSTAVFYNTMYDLNNHLNPITNSSAYLSPAATIYAQVTTPQGCTDVAQITLALFPVVEVQEATLRACAIETNPSTGLFDLTTAPVTTQSGTTKKYYPSLADAQNGTNEILTFSSYISPSGVVYIKVTNTNGCYAIAKVNLVVIPQVFSTTLEDKIICMEDTVILDAGPGFITYEWSTGATSQTITAGVGTYWVKLKTGDCVATQTVKVYASDQPVITSVDISNTTVTVYVNGGTAPYKYSTDGINWQDSNEFKNMPRGDSHIFVKDAYDCNPIDIGIVVPNLINVITPNGDGVNDVIDYSALAGKQNLVFNVYDRYGTLIHKSDKFSQYKWDGTMSGRKIPTGNYWYSVSWNENDKKNTSVKYSGWILVKNRD
ncbi:gliding motility-associated C-terminal domain-containing protein [Chryseobacterium taeanense]|uniref:Gliding motility-associated C-terminal domain-containing protein n=1 Tax=Chryseobacterium taeanense TaxID=311334 RepID=A0A1G8P8Z3_9FLAO|nr:T9SS type B sorting domain-containing protein [Chryseobacterium taeanense]SDI88806.1 gliding motility-associated C-terminal domain-containing protein [Chryseobacterium taeanense]